VAEEVAVELAGAIAAPPLAVDLDPLEPQPAAATIRASPSAPVIDLLSTGPILPDLVDGRAQWRGPPSGQRG
jgi:hypothetical protein